MSAPLVDIGANLTDKAFAADLDQVVTTAAQSGVQTLLITGTSLAESKKALALSQRFPQHAWCTAGVHPHHAKEWTPQHQDAIKALAADNKVVAIGETGLDYNRNFSPPDQQRDAFAYQLELASELNLPLFLHERDAHEDQLAILKSHLPKIPKGGVIHCFTGTRAELEQYLELDLYVGITGWICDERRGLHLRELVSLIPRHRLLLETDCPYLLPRTLKPKPKSRRNEPKYLAHINEEVASILKMEADELARQTSANAQALFGFDG